MTRQCFEHGTGSGSESIMKAEQNLTATLEEFSQNANCSLKSTHMQMSRQIFSCQSSQSTLVQLEPPPPVVTIDDDTTEKQKSIWVKINHIQSDKDALLENDWLNDQHIHAAQTLIKEQNPHINCLTL